MDTIFMNSQNSKRYSQTTTQSFGQNEFRKK